MLNHLSMLSPLARLCRAQLHPETGWQLTAEELPHVSHIQHWPLENRPIGLRPGYHKQIRYIIDAVRKVPPIPHTSTSGTVALSDGCGSCEVSWSRCEDVGFAVFRVVDAFVLAAEVVPPVGVEVAAGGEGAELEDGLGAFEAPPRACYVHSVLDDVP